MDRLSVSLKGNMLVAIPLVLMILFAAALTVEVNRAEAERARVASDRELLNSVTRLGYLFHKAFSNVYFLSLMGQLQSAESIKRMHARYLEYRDSMLTCSKSLVTQAQINSQMSPDQAKTLDDHVAKLVLMMDEVMYRVPQEQKFMYLTTHQGIFTVLPGVLSSALGPLREVDRDAPVLLNQSFERVLKLVVCGLLLSVCVAVLLALLFSRDISGRIRKLSSNVQRFSEKTPLLERDRGADEIALLDRSFRSAIEQLDQSEAVKRRFYAAVTSEMENPISRVRKIVLEVQDGSWGKVPPQAAEKLTTVNKNLERISLLVKDLEDIDLLDTGKVPLNKTTFASKALVERTRQMLESACAARKITVCDRSSDFEIHADEKRLCQILANYLSNAIKYSPAGSEIAIACRKEGSEVVLSVTDSGPGISEADRQKLFARFAQVSLSDAKRGAGTGLGLSVALLIAEAHGGTVGVDSKVGSGSTFWCRIPQV